MQTAEHRFDDNRLAQVLMPNARRDTLPDPLMGSGLIEVNLVLANQRIQVSVTEQDDVVEHLSPATANKSLRDGIHVGARRRGVQKLIAGIVEGLQAARTRTFWVFGDGTAPSREIAGGIAPVLTCPKTQDRSALTQCQPPRLAPCV
jgi:hypothetical protein